MFGRQQYNLHVVFLNSILGEVVSHKYHFISGLPRSGSTLLAALLRQNPRFHAGMSSPVVGLFSLASSHLSSGHELYANISDTSRFNVLRGLFDSYYLDIKGKDVIFDTGRAWTSKMGVLHTILPGSMTICCVRPATEIVASIENLIDRSPLEISGIFDNKSEANIYIRCEQLKSSKGIIGSALLNLKDAFYGKFSDNLILVNYTSLAREPIGVLKAIYDFIDEPWFEHNPDHVYYEADAFDQSIGAKGLHRVEGPVAPRQREVKLPPEIIQIFKQSDFWMDQNNNVNNVRII